MSAADPLGGHRVAFIGGGNMARALIGGLLARGAPPENLSVGEALAAQREAFAGLGVPASADNAAAIRDAAVTVLAVKPQDAATALRPLSAAFGAQRPLLVSVAAGLRVADLAIWCGAGVRIVRAMPNRPALVGAGATGLYAGSDVGDADRALAATILGAVGSVIWVASEAALDVVTALSGSGPAYFFRLAELLAEAAVDLGLDPVAAHTLAIDTLHGSGMLARAGDGDLGRLRAEVTSKGGTTEAALRVLEAADLRAMVAAAVRAAADRSRELATQFGAAPEPGSKP